MTNPTNPEDVREITATVTVKVRVAVCGDDPRTDEEVERAAHRMVQSVVEANLEAGEWVTDDTSIEGVVDPIV